MMKPLWRLEVEGLGKIERAEVDVRRLTLFVGPNNTGKSYLASLLWGLVAMQGDLRPPEGPERDAVDGWLHEKLPRDQSDRQFDLHPDELTLFDELFRVTLKAHAAELTKRIFNSESVRAGEVHFRNLAARRQLHIAARQTDHQYQVGVVWPDHASWLDHAGADATSHEQIMMPKAREMLMRHAAFGHLARDGGPFENAFRRGDPIYLPASRTGFMLLYKAAARRGLQGAFRRDPDAAEWLDLTTPIFHFIDMIAFGLKGKLAGHFAEEADFLQREMTGRIELVETPGVNEFRYHPTGALVPLSMSLSSALVTELAPLILVLRHLAACPALVVEEPEAHLHPELQRRLAQVIVRLVRKGIIVWITTHSENFCQEINNFIKLGSLPPDRRTEAQQKLGYGSQDFLELDDVSGYELKPDAGGERSTVAELKRTEAGLIMPTFNRAIGRLSDDVAYLDSLLAGEHG